jgi:hypothetical protein
VAASECGSCRETFGNLTLFDAHQAWDRSGEWVLTCLLPGDLGLVRDSRGIWQTPEGLANNQRLTAILASSARPRRAVTDVQLPEVLPGRSPAARAAGSPLAAGSMMEAEAPVPDAGASAIPPLSAGRASARRHRSSPAPAAPAAAAGPG